MLPRGGISESSKKMRKERENMIKTIYARAGAVLAKKPMVLWGISLLEGVLCIVSGILFGAVIGISIAINLLLSTGMTMVYLHGYRGEAVQSVQLFDCCKDGKTCKRVLGGMAWQMLWIFLWGLIPVVGFVFAIIRSYEYRLVPYILVTEPDVPATEAIKVSRERTKGYKGKMFGADILVYVIILAVCLVLGLLGAIPYLGVLFRLALVVFAIGALLFTPLFLGLVQAAFYEEISHPTMPTESEPAAPQQ